MAKYESNPDGKYQCPLCDYGNGPGNGKSRQSVSKHFNKVHQDDSLEPGQAYDPGEETVLIEIEEDQDEPVAFNFTEAEAEAESEPSWMNAGVLEAEEIPIRPSPMSSPVKGFLKSLNKEAGVKKKGKKRSAGEQKAWAAQQARLVRWGYVCIDRLVVWWGRGVLEEPSWDISRTEDEWKIMEASTTAFLDHHNLSVPVNPDLVFVATLAGAYGPPVRYVAKNKKKQILSWKNPIKAYFARRKLKKMAKAREGETFDRS
jgi:hypothetical protein